MSITQLKLTDARNTDGSGVYPLAAAVVAHTAGIDLNNGGLALLVQGKKEPLRVTNIGVFWETYIPGDYQEGDNPALVVNAQYHPPSLIPPAPSFYTGTVVARVVKINPDGTTDGKNLIYTATSAPLTPIPVDYTFTINGTGFVSGTKLLVYVTLQLRSPTGDTTGMTGRISSVHYNDTYITE